MKAELAAEEGRLLCTQCRTEMFPDEEGFYEFERRGGGRKRKTEEEVSSCGIKSKFSALMAGLSNIHKWFTA